MRTLTYGIVGSCFVFACTKEPHDEKEWQQYVEFVRTRLEAGVKPRALVVTDGAGPTSAQREQLSKVLEPHAKVSRAAVLTESRLGRGIVTALSWFVPGFRAFAPRDMDRALDYLEVPPISRKEVIGLVEDLQRELGVEMDLRATKAG